MGLTQEEQRELDELELAELEDQEAQESQIQKKPKVAASTKAKAALEGAGRGYTFGLLPQAQALFQKGVVDRYIEPAYELATGRQIEDETFTQAREGFSKRAQNLATAAPEYFTGGEVAGGLAMPVPGMGKLKALSQAKGLIPKAASLATTQAGKGAVEGALYSPESEPGQFFSPQLKQRGEQALAGGFGAGVLSKIGGRLKRAATKGKELSDQMVIKAMGGQTPEFRKVNKKRKLPEVAKFARDEKIVTRGSDVIDAVERSDKILKDSWSELKTLYSRVNDKLNDVSFTKSLKLADQYKLSKTKLAPKIIASNIMNNLMDSLKNSPNKETVLNAVSSKLKTLEERDGIMDIPSLLDYRKGMDDLINYDKTVRDMPAVQQAFVTVRNELQSRIDKRIRALDQVLGTDDVKRLKQLNRKYSNASIINSMSRSAQDRDMGRAVHGLYDRMAAIGPASGYLGYQAYQGDFEPSDLITAGAISLAGKGISKASRKYGPGLLEPIVRKSGLLRKPGQFLESDLLRRGAQRTLLGPDAEE